VNIIVYIEPHERLEAIQAYGDRLSDVQKEQIENAPDDAHIRLQLWPGKANVIVVRHQ
jgi:hypothetical protein